MSKKDIKEQLKQFIIKKVKDNTSPTRPYFFIKWSGLNELCKSYQIDLLSLIDEMAMQGIIKKALIKKRLAIYLPEYTSVVSKKARDLKSEFENFLSK